ncbi:MAG: hypothetical protein ABJK20_08590 [Halieaceae bacterium]
MKFRTAIAILVSSITLLACKHPLQIEGEGDIIELETGARGCSLDEFRAGLPNCTDNEVSDDETAVYRALPRPGWKFSHWQGFCDKKYPGDDCRFIYSREVIEAWDDANPGLALAPLVAIFVEDTEAPAAAPYILSRFGAQGNFGFAELLDALFTVDGSYRITTAQATTRGEFDRSPAAFARQSDSLLLAGPDAESLIPAGGATAAGDFLALADTDNSDNAISASYLVPEQTEADPAVFQGIYYCGHIMSDGRATFFRANLNGKGGGSMVIESDRQGRSRQSIVSYTVEPDGTTTFDYAGLRLAGGLSEDGSLFAATQISARLQGAAMCLRTSGDKMVGNVAGSYYGAWMSTQPVAGVTELQLNNQGTTVETVIRDSVGGRNYSLGQDFMLVKATGQLETRESHGAISANGQVMFLINTSPNKFPTLVVYVRKT